MYQACDQFIKDYSSTSSFNNIIENSPLNIELIKNLSEDSYADFILENTFTIFKSINNNLYLVYSNYHKSIILYNINTYKKINEIKNAHQSFITNFRHYFDRINKRDIVLSISCRDSNVKLWDNRNYQCILNLKTDESYDSLAYSACLFEDKNNNYIVVGNYNHNNNFIKVYNLDGNTSKIMNNNETEVYFVCVYCDKSNKNYIISGNLNNIKSFDYDSGKLYKEYNQSYPNGAHNSIIIKEDNITKLLESCTDGFIRIWDFHNGKLLDKIEVDSDKLFSIFLWNNKYLFNKPSKI